MDVTAMNGALAREWSREIFEATKRDGINPLRSARVHAYAMLALYESLVHGSSHHRSLAGQLNGLTELPQPQSDLTYDWPTVAASTMAIVEDGLFDAPETTTTGAALRDNQIQARVAAGVGSQIILDSTTYAEALGNALLSYASSDGFAEIKDKPYDLPAGEGFWVPTDPGFAPAMEPYWGTLRLFVMPGVTQCQAPAPAPYSTVVGSAFYEQAYAVYLAVKNINDEQYDQALYWEDAPATTACATGQIMDIIAQLSAIRNSNLIDTAETMALTMIEQADGFVMAWYQKYQTMVIRPISYIQNVIDPNWQTTIATPPFPEYPSGHSVSAGGAKIMLRKIWGDMAFDNRTYDYLGYAPRHYDDFTEMADDDGWSRLVAGVHYPMAIENGIAMGECVAENFLSRVSTRN